MRRYFLLMGALVLMLSLIAACGDDDDSGDDDTDIADDITVTVPDTGDEATEADDSADMTATTADGAATGTEADMSGTESDSAAGTMDADATGTEDDDDADDGTETDDDDATGTEDDDDATGTEDDDEATGTEDDDVAEGTADDDGDDDGFGEPVTVGDFILTVNDVMVLESGGIVAPDEGNQFLGVEMTIENTGTDQIGLSRALLQTHLEDDDGEEYEIDLAATAVAIFSGGFDAQAEIEPGAEITGIAGFQVPEDLSPEDLTLVIEPEGAERIEIPLDGDDDTE